MNNVLVLDPGTPGRPVARETAFDAAVRVTRGERRSVAPGRAGGALPVEQRHRPENDMCTVHDNLPALVASWDDQLRGRSCNVAHESWFGLTAQQMCGRHLREVIGTPLFDKVRPYVDRALRGQAQVFEPTIADARGTLRHAVCAFIPDMGNDGGARGLFVLVTDVSGRKATEDRLDEEKERLRMALDAISDGVITTDNDGRVTYQNAAATAMTGWTPGQALRRPIENVVRIERLQDRAEAASPIRTALAHGCRVESRAGHVLVHRAGKRVHIEDSAAPMRDDQGALRGAVMVFHEVGHARATARRMAHLAQHDALTGLPNRRLLRERARLALARAARSKRHVAMLYLDLDRFKAVNDTLGHAVGDELLIAVANRLAVILRQGDTLCRNGGDEFIALMDGYEDPAEATRLAARLIDACRQPFMIGGKALNVTASIGISVYPDDATDMDTLLRLADKAMYASKRAGRDRYTRFDARDA